MAFDPFDPKNNPTIKPNKNQQDIDKALSYGIDTEDMVPEAEKNNEVSGATAFVAGLGSGAIKTVEGVVSLGAELLDLGATENSAAQVEAFFDKLNPLEEIAEQRAIGRLSEALVQIGIPGAAGAKPCTGAQATSLYNVLESCLAALCVLLFAIVASLPANILACNALAFLRPISITGAAALLAAVAPV